MEAETDSVDELISEIEEFVRKAVLTEREALHRQYLEKAYSEFCDSCDTLEALMVQLEIMDAERQDIIFAAFDESKDVLMENLRNLHKLMSEIITSEASLDIKCAHISGMGEQKSTETVKVRKLLRLAEKLS